jgi:hypothetical protein
MLPFLQYCPASFARLAHPETLTWLGRKGKEKLYAAGGSLWNRRMQLDLSGNPALHFTQILTTAVTVKFRLNSIGQCRYRTNNGVGVNLLCGRPV